PEAEQDQLEAAAQRQVDERPDHTRPPSAKVSERRRIVALRRAVLAGHGHDRLLTPHELVADPKEDLHRSGHQEVDRPGPIGLVQHHPARWPLLFGGRLGQADSAHCGMPWKNDTRVRAPGPWRRPLPTGCRPTALRIASTVTSAPVAGRRTQGFGRWTPVCHAARRDIDTRLVVPEPGPTLGFPSRSRDPELAAVEDRNSFWEGTAMISKIRRRAGQLTALAVVMSLAATACAPSQQDTGGESSGEVPDTITIGATLPL